MSTIGGGEQLAVSSCAAFPDASIGAGNDVAYCLLDAPFDAPTVPIVATCERELVVPGTDAVLVGYGYDAELDGRAGQKRFVTTEVMAAGLEVEIGDQTRGSCAGDSGGPAFVQLDTKQNDLPRLRLLGVLSSGEFGRCGRGWYSDVTSLVAWLEHETQRDLTPCFDAQGKWVPTPKCIEPMIDTDGVLVGGSALPSDSCGQPARLWPQKNGPLVMDLNELDWEPKTGRIRAEVEVRAEVNDIEEVVFEVHFSDADAKSARLTDEIPPYRLELDLPSEAQPKELSATARTFSGLVSRQTWPLNAGSGCGIGDSVRRTPMSALYGLALIGIVLRNRSRRSAVSV